MPVDVIVASTVCASSVAYILYRSARPEIETSGLYLAMVGFVGSIMYILFS